MRRTLSNRSCKEGSSQIRTIKNTREQFLDLKKECDELEASRRNLETQHRHLQVN